MGSLSVGERWAAVWLLVAMLVFAGWGSLEKWREKRSEVKRGAEVNWQESKGVARWE